MTDVNPADWTRTLSVEDYFMLKGGARIGAALVSRPDLAEAITGLLDRLDSEDNREPGPFTNDPGMPGAVPCTQDHDHTTMCRIFGDAPVHTPRRTGWSPGVHSDHD